MELTFWLIILGVYSLICFVISSFFEDREIGKWTVFWFSVILSPIIGILIGLSSKRIEVQSKPTSTKPITVSSGGIKRTIKPQSEIKSSKDRILDRLEEIKRLEGVELGSDELTKEKERLKEQFKSLSESSKQEKPKVGDLSPEDWVEMMVPYLKKHPNMSSSDMSLSDKKEVMSRMETTSSEEDELYFEIEDDGVLYTFRLQMEEIGYSGYSKLKDFKYSKEIVK
jgi:hypothetical protein